MADTLEILDLADSGQLQLSIIRDAGTRDAGIDGTGSRSEAPPVNFPFPLTDAELLEMAWLLTGYALNPFGDSRQRAEAVESGLRGLGGLMMQTVFRSSPAAEEILARVLSGDGGPLGISVVSDRPEFLSLPWELINDPDVGYLAARTQGIFRQLTTSSSLPTLSVADLPEDRFNVLMLCPPSSDGIATEALSAMESLDVEVSLDTLRPASVELLEEHLSQRKGHYHLLHLDGIKFEDGGAHLAGVGPLGRIAQIIADARIPVTLVACSALDYIHIAVEKLVEGGAPEAAVLPVPLGGSGRKLFADAFYAGIARGDGAAAAVAAARRALMEHPHRPSAAGPLVSWDWITPMAYRSAQYTPVAVKAEEPEPVVPGMISATPEPPPRQLPRAGPYGLTGRRREILELEEIIDRNSVTLLNGAVGVGKSEMALGLAAWVEKNGGRPEGVFYTNFDAGAGLDKALHEVGTALAGLEFGDLSTAARRSWLLDYLREHETLLVWDSVDNLAGFPNAGTGLLEEDELTELDEFLGDLAADGGKSRVLLVSRRNQEPWLSTPHGNYELGGLTGRDRVELATRLIEESGVDSARMGQEFLELLDLLEGHPLGMEVAIPLLRDVPASVLLAELRRETEGYQPGPGEEGRPAYLTALMDHAFGRMPRRSRTHLPFLSLFRSRVMMDILTHITQESPYRSVMGEQLGWGACRTLLRSAREGGFLEPITPSVYQIHPAMSWFYGRALYRQMAPARVAELEAEFVRVYADTADYFMETLYENQDSGTNAILAEEGNLTQALALSLETRQWDNAQLLTQPLAQVYRMQKRYPELRRLRRQLLEATGTTADEATANGASELWLYLLGTEASECIETNELGRADDLNRQLLDYFTAQADADGDPRTAAVYHQMGEVALKRWQLDQAEGWYTQSLAIIESGEDRASVADDYYGMGLVRQYQRRYTEARDWFSKSLDIHQRLEDVEEMVKDYRSLGLCAQFRFEYQEAESWYHRAREILEEARDEETSVLIYHALGTVAHSQYQFDDAENWYQQALTLSDRMGNESQMAVEFHYLGLLEQGRQMFPEDAEHWYKLALEKYEKLGDWRNAGDECRQLGVLFHEQEKLEEAESWYHRAREIFEEIQDVSRTARTYGQLGMAAEERQDIEGALTWAARTYQLAADQNLAVIGQARVHLARLRDKHGSEAFAEWWFGFAGEEPPTDLDEEEGAIL